jgi:hypothetical protein
MDFIILSSFLPSNILIIFIHISLSFYTFHCLSPKQSPFTLTSFFRSRFHRRERTCSIFLCKFGLFCSTLWLPVLFSCNQRNFILHG